MAGSRTRLYAPLQDSQQHQSSSESTKDKAVQGVRKLCAEQNYTPFASKTLQFSQVKSLCLISVQVLLSEQEIAFLSVGASYNEGSM